MEWPGCCKTSLLLLSFYYLWPSSSFGHHHRWNNEHHGLSSASMRKVSPDPQYMRRETWGVLAPRLSLRGVLWVCRGVPSPALPGAWPALPIAEWGWTRTSEEALEDKKAAQGMARQSHRSLGLWLNTQNWKAAFLWAVIEIVTTPLHDIIDSSYNYIETSTFSHTLTSNNTCHKQAFY